MDYLDAVRDQILAELRGRPLSVMRVLRGQKPFMQKNLPKYTPPWVPRVRLWAESSRREVCYALCDDRRTLLWFANQRAVEYHPTLSEAGQQNHPDYLVMDIDPPSGGDFRLVVRAAQLVREALSGCGLAGAVKTSGAKGVHVFVPITQASAEDAAAATRAVAARAERLDPVLTTTAFIREDREGKVFLDSTRAGGATVAAAYSPRIRPGVPVSFPLPWDELDQVTPADFTVRTAARLITPGARWAGQLPSPQRLPADLVAEGHTIPIARARPTRTAASERRVVCAPVPTTRRADAGDRLLAVAPGAEAQPAERQQGDPQPRAEPEPEAEPRPGPERDQPVPGGGHNGDEQHDQQHPRPLWPGPARRRDGPGPGRASAGSGGRAGPGLRQVVGDPGQVGPGLRAHRPGQALV